MANAITFAVQILCYVVENHSSSRAYTYFMQYFALDTHMVTSKFWFWQLLTYAFLHSVGDIFHIFFNLLSLFFFGHCVESYYGTKKFLIFYALCAIFAGLFYLALQFFYPGRTMMLGASGAIMGVLVFSACVMPDSTVLFYFIFPMKMRTLVWILVGLDVYMVLIPRGGVAASAHLGGALFGYLSYRYSAKISAYYYRWKRNLAIEYQKEQEKTYANIREDVDKILDKIQQNGIQSLTPQEKEFLQNASKKYQKK